MSKGITVIYEKGILRPLQPLELPENSRLEIQIIEMADEPNGELMAARHALQQAGVIRKRSQEEIAPVSDEEIEQAYEVLGAAGPVSAQIIEDREGR